MPMLYDLSCKFSVCLYSSHTGKINFYGPNMSNTKLKVIVIIENLKEIQESLN